MCGIIGFVGREQAAPILLDGLADFVPALVLYANFAFESNRERAENSIQLEIRSAGTTTLEMERFDRRMKIPVSDAVFRINSTPKKDLASHSESKRAIPFISPPPKDGAMRSTTSQNFSGSFSSISISKTSIPP